MDTTLLPSTPIRDEHRAFLPRIERLTDAAEHAGVVPDPVLLIELRAAAAFLKRQILPHARAEDEVLYPAVASFMGAPDATATMSRDHVAVERLGAELGSLIEEIVEHGLDPARGARVRRVLYGLHAILRVHLAKEEELYLPILDDRLTRDEVADLVHAMERAAKRAREG